MIWTDERTDRQTDGRTDVMRTVRTHNKGRVINKISHFTQPDYD